MNIKLILFFSMIVLILSVGAVSSADLNDTHVTDLTDSVDDVVVDNTLEPCPSETGNISIADGKQYTETSEIGISTNTSETENTTIDRTKANGTENSSINKPELDIKGPKITDLPNIPEPKLSFDSLQADINKVAKGGTLYLYADYKGLYGSRIQLNKDITIDGRGHTLDCAGQGGCSAFYSNSGNIILKNLRIINGHNDYTNKGGAIYITGSAKYTLENCTFENNWADRFGGAIYNDVDNALTIINCRFISNTANSVDGGAIYSIGAVNVENSLFKSNVADEYGGAIASKKNVNVKGSTFIGNMARSRDWDWYEYIYHWVDNPNCKGGAIFTEEDLIINNSTFENNTSEDYAGAVYAKNVRINSDQSTMDGFNSFFIGNVAKDDDAGAVYAKESITAINAVFKGNKALADGGAFYACANADVKNCLFESNRIEGAKSQCKGGAIRAKGDVYVDNCTFSKNFAYDYGGAIYAKNIRINAKQDNNQSFNTFFYDNSASDNDGGALYSDGGDVTVKNAIFSGNTAYCAGGGIYSGGKVDTYHCEFIKNTALKGIGANGGGIYSEDGVIVENCTFKDNHCHGNGPAIYCVKNIDINQNSNGKDYKSHFINNTGESGQYMDQVTCDKDHGKIKYKNTEIC